MSHFTPLPAVVDPDCQRRHDLLEAIYRALLPFCDEPSECGALYPKFIYNTPQHLFCGYLRDRDLHFPADGISAMIGGVLYVISVPAIPPKPNNDLQLVKFVASDLGELRNLLDEISKRRAVR